MAMTPEEWEAERRKNDATARHNQGNKGSGNRPSTSGNKRDNEKRPNGGDQRDDRYDD